MQQSVIGFIALAFNYFLHFPLRIPRQKIFMRRDDLFTAKPSYRAKESNRETVMKKDVAFAIALMIAGVLGLVYPPKFSAGVEPIVKPAHVLRIEPSATTSLLTNTTEVHANRCSRSTQAKANLLHKVSVAISDLDAVISLQSM